MSEIRHKSGKTELERRVCVKCKMYYPTLKVSQWHVKWCRSQKEEDGDEEEDDPLMDEGNMVKWS